jgi:GntR family transcriptional regulator
MLIEIEVNPRIPIYLQIATGVRRAVAEGRLGPGDRLPTGRELAHALGVNLDTVQRA